MVAEHKVDRFSDLFGQLGVLGQSVRARGEVARDDHDFAGRLIDGLIKLVPRPMAAKFQVKVGEPGKALYVVGYADFRGGSFRIVDHHQSDSSIFGSSRLMIIDRKTLQNCNLSAASWLALSRICPEVFTKLSHISRGVHQCAELPVVRFPRQQRKCGPLAGLDGTVALCLDAFSLRDQQLESLLYQAIHAAASGALEKNRPVGFA